MSASRALDKLLPSTLWGRVLLVLLAGLAVAHAASFVAAWLDRSWTFQRVQARGLAESIAHRVRHPGLPQAFELRAAPVPAPPPAMLTKPLPPGQTLPPPEAATDIFIPLGPPLAWSVSTEPPAPAEDDRPAPGRVEEELRGTLKRLLGTDPVVRVAVKDGPRNAGDVLAAQLAPAPGAPLGHATQPLAAAPELRRLVAVVRLPDGRHASAEGVLLTPTLRLPSDAWLGIGLVFLLTAAFSVWAAHLAVRPVRELSSAAERLSRNLDEPPLPEKGAREIREAARAFNRMQDRLRRHVTTRALAFAALSHDMRTPLTRIHLRLESLDEPGQREKLRADLDEIAALARSALEVTRGLAREEPESRVALLDMAHAVAEDFASMGRRVEVSGELLEVTTRPRALRRVVANLVDNATTHADGAEVHVTRSREGASIVVADRGPGIPEAELAKVTSPYYRVEGSRSRETGGAGLGLAIAKDLAEALGGELTLANRQGGGFEARVWLPFARPRSPGS